MGAIQVRPARIQDVAAAAGVSVSTVSNVLNRPERVNARTAERVRDAVAALDYVPHPGAAGLRTGHSSSIGLVLPDVANTFYSRIARGAADAAYDHGYSLVLCDSGDAPEREQGYFTMLIEQRAVGAVVVPLGADPTRLTRLRERGIPLVLADRALPAQDGCSVSVDDIAGGRIAVQHLLDCGARDILVVNGERGIVQCADRYQGARQAVRTRREARIRQLVADEMTVAYGLEIARGLDELPDGVFCTNDFLAAGLCRGLGERGCGYPRRYRSSATATSTSRASSARPSRRSGNPSRNSAERPWECCSTRWRPAPNTPMRPGCSRPTSSCGTPPGRCQPGIRSVTGPISPDAS